VPEWSVVTWLWRTGKLKSAPTFPLLRPRDCVSVGATEMRRVLLALGLTAVVALVAAAAAAAAVKVAVDDDAERCGAARDCTTCNDHAQCVWCLTTRTCMLGNSSGPTHGSECARWSASHCASASSSPYGYGPTFDPPPPPPPPPPSPSPSSGCGVCPPDTECCYGRCERSFCGHDDEAAAARGAHGAEG
jgi:hypothetical protein